MSVLTIFVSSPGDVNEERVITARVIKRLSEYFADRVKLEPLFWEHEPMLMTETFQTQIKPPSETDIFLGILWARIGTRLPANITRPDGSRYESGTEYEFEDAWAGFEQYGKPEILIYRKMAAAHINPDMPDYQARLAQKQALDVFNRKWFQDEEGSFVAAFNPFNNLAEFEERLEDHLRKLIERRYPSTDTDTHLHAITWRQGSPFRGLDYFTEQHTSVFFGRTRMVSEILEMLRNNALHKQAFLLISGMSGSGKSSLLRSGVLPMLTQPGVIEGVAAWKQILLNLAEIQHEPLLALAAAIEQNLELSCARAHSQPYAKRTTPPLLVLLNNILRAEQLDTHLAQELEQCMCERLNQIAYSMGAQAGQVRVIISLDQLDALFSLPQLKPEALHSFFQALAWLSQTGLVWVLATLRSDFYPRIAEYPILAKLVAGNGQYLLTVPTVGELSQMIRLPAYAAGLQFESNEETGTRLDEELLQSMVKNPENLALLEFTLDALYEQRSATGYLTFAAYELLGGLEGALAQRAEMVYHNVSVEAQMAMPTLMRTLISLDNDNNMPITGRRFLYQESDAEQPRYSAMQELLEAFIKARLVVTDRAEDGISIARITHDSLLQHWPRLQNWVTENYHLLQMRVRIKTAARLWIEEKHNPELLLPEGKPLSQGEELLRQWPESIDPFIHEYIECSLRAVTEHHRALEQQTVAKLRLSRRLAEAFAMLAILAVLSGLYAYQQSHKAEQHALLAQQQAVLAEQDKNHALRTQSMFLSALAQQEAKDGQIATALSLSLEALPRLTGDSDKQRPYAVAAEISLRKSVSDLRERHILRGHNAGIWNLDFSADGKWLASAGDDNQVRLWNTGNGQLKTVFNGHQNQVWDVVFSPDQERLLTASLDSTARLWNVHSGALLVNLAGHSGELYHANFSPDGNRIASAAQDGTIHIWDGQSGMLDKVLRGHQGAVFNAVFSPVAGIDLLASASRDGTVRIWDLTTGKTRLILSEHEEQVNQVLFSPQGEHLLSISDDGVALLWDVNTGERLQRMDKHQAAINAARFSPDGRWVATASQDKTAILWNDKGEAKHRLRAHQGAVTSLAFSPDSMQLATASRDGKLRLWKTRSGRLQATLVGHESAIHKVEFSPDGQLLASASKDQTLRLWQTRPTTITAQLSANTDLQQLHFSPDSQYALGIFANTLKVWNTHMGHLIKRIQTPTTTLTASFSPNAERLLSGHQDHHARLWHVKTGQFEVLRGHHDEVHFTAFSPDGKTLLTASLDNEIRLWNRYGRLKMILGGHSNAPIQAASFSPDSQLFASTARNQGIDIWSSQGLFLRKLAIAGFIKQLLFSPSGETLLSVGKNVKGQGIASLWSVTDGHLLQTLEGHEGEVYKAAFSTDGNTIATASWDGSIRLWESASGLLQQQFDGHRGWVTDIRFCAQDKRLLSLSRDGSVRLWSRKSGEELGWVNRNMHHSGLARFSDNCEYLMTDYHQHVYLWKVLPELKQVIFHARNILPEPLTPAQRKRFFIE
ncbi:nSTAND1 domain-containing NTPase [Candidatus Venteria ishoeyi]|uniref:Translocation protein TolB n=1 Tax=Candidatus Venteria ishoeyi TaxID=1899563 RepID=A0A1H6FDJ8_9GAMM|nr:hypothetical protein [Candidatus Venteria ishoeyi]SEH07104.1 translocation protein TolB [Candidatus Venteria ishoeyi]